jgi:hypothetical protein
LKILHEFIADAFAEKLGENYEITSLREDNSHEKNVRGRYYDKKVDIAISRNGQPVAAIAVKFVMSNYTQNSNNYFESMLGETANLRSNKIPYFHIVILTENAPYFQRDGEKIISKIEKIAENNLNKYRVLAGDNIEQYLHSPNKTLLYVVKTSRNVNDFLGKSKAEYIREMLKKPELETHQIANIEFEEGVIFNDFAKFIEKVSHYILSL